jgi:hypothetical protein
MYAQNPGGTLTMGQVFRAHFDVRSSLNVVYGLRPAAELRDCQGSPGIRPTPCLPPTFGR